MFAAWPFVNFLTSSGKPDSPDAIDASGRMSVVGRMPQRLATKACCVAVAGYCLHFADRSSLDRILFIY